MPRLAFGKAVNFALHNRTATGLAIAGAAAFAVGQVRPFEPVSELAQEELLGDPNAIQTMFSGSVKSAVSDTFLGASAEERIAELRRPIQRDPYEPNGALVLGMYAARRG